MSPLSYLATENMMPGLNPRPVSVFQGGGGEEMDSKEMKMEYIQYETWN